MENLAFLPAPQLVWAIACTKYERSDGFVKGPTDPDDWWAYAVIGWSDAGAAVVWSGELETVTPETEGIWAICPDAQLATLRHEARRAVAYAKTGSYQLASDPPEPPFGEAEAA